MKKEEIDKNKFFFLNFDSTFSKETGLGENIEST